MRVIVDYDLCEGNLRCMQAAPEVFDVREDELAHVLLERPPETMRPQVERAARLCPKQAIKIIEES